MTSLLMLLFMLGCAAQPKQADLREPSERDVQHMRYQMAERLVQKRDYQSAAPYIRSLLQKFPKSARLHLLLGKVLRAKGVYKGAQQELKRALALAPTDADVHTALAVLFGFTKRYDAAERAHRRALELAPKIARHHNDFGAFLLARRRLKEAREALEEAIRLNPSMRRAFNNLGFVLGLMGEHEPAMKAFSQAGSRAAALTNMGVVAQLRGQPMSARRYYEKALQREQGYRPALKNLEALEPGRFGDETPASQPKKETRDAKSEAKSGAH
ncbi:MAG: tetratricopeptide repeat protein [Deltaproteobacteria bacterium]|nr:tetratricopeptide repeat protein [Deltaproteobacteria bacterium]